MLHIERNEIREFEMSLLEILGWDALLITPHTLTMAMLEFIDDKSQREKMAKVTNSLLRVQFSRKKDYHFVNKYSAETIALGCLRAAFIITGTGFIHQETLSKISSLVEPRFKVRNARWLGGWLGACVRACMREWG